ncbi:proline and serine-rich protein 3 [Bombina bombina]|uniref:proline and serine-rich protein 3 n=1 Tax=Bombina bombina TaxID=8345 RepID=UPI00235AAB6E|nr:proline and serine-rich protein 3 [Bombina bombina]
MNSSIAVFSNQGNPFPVPVRNRTHYHPSQPLPLTAEQKQIVLSPARLSSVPAHLSDALSPPDLRFLEGSQQLVPGLPSSDSSGPFDESWPSSDGSAYKTPELDEQEATVDSVLKYLQRDPASDPSSTDSVIARYVARFRNGRPTSRTERSPPKQDMKDFWWLQTSPDSPDTERYRTDTGIQSLLFSPQDLEKTPPHEDGSLNESKLYSENVDVVRLQDRAGKLILRSESSLSSEVPVSSNGLGSSPLSSVSNCSSSKPLTSLQPAPVVSVHLPQTVSVPPSVRSHSMLTPEEDILYQWRLRRKMEQAREGTLPLPSRGRTPSPPVRIPKPVVHTDNFAASVYCGQTKEEAHVPCIPFQTNERGQLPVSSASTIPIASPTLATNMSTFTVPPHMHLLCDILPCTQSHVSTKQESNKGRPQQAPSTATPAPAEEQRKEVHSGQYHKVLPSHVPGKKYLKKTERVEDRRVKQRKDEPKAARGRNEMKKDIRTKVVDETPPESQVHLAVGEVISERLFSPIPSPKPKLVVKMTKSATPPAEPASNQQPLELAAQLLEEAEDSDGTEFADDPLLQVLREQREALRVRLRTVDLQLTDMESQTRVG